MRRAFIIISIIALAFMLVSCSTGLEFRSHRFGDSKNKVIESEEGTPEEDFSEFEDRTYLRYNNIEIAGYSGNLAYIFNDDVLEQIFYYIPSYGKMYTVEEAYSELINEYKKYGVLMEDELLKNGTHKAILKSGDSGLVLAINKGNYCVLFHQSYEKCEMFYNTISSSVLISDTTGE